MNPTELKATRRLLFMTMHECSAMVGVQERSWRRWESGTHPIPDEIIEKMTSLLVWRKKTIDAASSTIARMSMAHGKPKETRLVEYLEEEDWCAKPDHPPAIYLHPAQSANAATYAIHQNVRIVPFDRESYFEWLGNRPDTLSARSEWAAST